MQNFVESTCSHELGQTPTVDEKRGYGRLLIGMSVLTPHETTMLAE